jgi:hypothetical protein
MLAPTSETRSGKEHEMTVRIASDGACGGRWVWFSFMATMALLALSGSTGADARGLLAGGFLLLAPFVYFHHPLRADERPLASWSTAERSAALAGLAGVVAVLAAAWTAL